MTNFNNLITMNASENLQTYQSESHFKEWNYEVGNIYEEGEFVSDGREVKKVVQDFVTNGDESWWYAPSLFEEIPKSSTLEGVEIDLNTLQLGEPITKTLTNENGDEENYTITLIDAPERNNRDMIQPEGFYTTEVFKNVNHRYTHLTPGFNFTESDNFTMKFVTTIYKNQYGSTEISGVFRPYNNSKFFVNHGLGIIKKSGTFNNPSEAKYYVSVGTGFGYTKTYETGIQLYGGIIHYY